MAKNKAGLMATLALAAATLTGCSNFKEQFETQPLTEAAPPTAPIPLMPEGRTPPHEYLMLCVQGVKPATKEYAKALRPLISNFGTEIVIKLAARRNRKTDIACATYWDVGASLEQAKKDIGNEILADAAKLKDLAKKMPKYKNLFPTDIRPMGPVYRL